MSGLAFEGVSHRYGSLLAVDSVELAVRPGETVCLLGPSGCGKSTLLRLAAGLEELQTGRIEIGGRAVAAAGARSRVPPEERSVGLVFQDYALFPHLTVLENIRYGLPGGRSGGKDRARRALAELGMSDLAERYPHALSGGQQQRVALLRALVPRPRVMLLDEPFSTLDEHLRHEVRMETMNLLAGSGAVTVLVTHDAEEAMLLGDRIVVMQAGRIVQDASPGEVYARPSNLFTARLFGPLNLFEGTVRGGLVETPLGPVEAVGFADSSRVSVAVRADGIELVSTASVPTDCARVRVRSVRRLGAWTLVLMTPGDVTREALGAGEALRETVLEARVPGGAELIAGDVYAVRTRPEKAFVFAAGSG
ncbi:MAG: ABC transporter ATP-binding protein [Immundisolibacterales bacterium]|nr:ABC transporter ATP-binding protein [Immundisolibacterales bacterium]